MIYEIEDEILNKLEAIRLVAPELAREQMSRGGEIVKTAMRKNMVRHKHNWFTKRDKKGDLYIYENKKKTKVLGRRTKADGSNLNTPESMSNFITNYFDEKNGLLVVGGSHRGFNPILRDKGKVTGRGGYVKGIGKHTKAIIHKMNSGQAGENYGWWYKNSLRKLKDEPNMEKKKFRAWNFMRDGINDTKSEFNSLITTEYDRLFMQTVMNQKVKVRKIV